MHGGMPTGYSSLSGWLQFDGNVPHCTLPYTGTRYTFTFFSQQSFSRLGEAGSCARHVWGMYAPCMYTLLTPQAVPLLRVRHVMRHTGMCILDRQGGGVIRGGGVFIRAK